MKTKLTRMIAAVLAMLLALSCVACGKDQAEPSATSVSPTQTVTAPEVKPEDEPTQPTVTQPAEPETPVEPETPTEPETPVEPETPAEPEKPVEPKPQPPVEKNEYFNPSNYEMVEEQLAVKPRHVYWEDGNLVAECFVINGDAYKVHSVQVMNLLLETSDGKKIAEALFDYTHEDEVPYGGYYTHTFTFSGEQISLPNADLKNVVVKYGLSWQQIHNEYYNQDFIMYQLGNGYIADDDAAYLHKKAEVRVRWAYWGEGVLNVRLNVANGTDTPITNVNVTNLTITNAKGIILSDAFGILQAEDYTNITVEPGQYVDVDVVFEAQGANNELIHAQWSIDASCAKVEQMDPFEGATDEQILACMEICRAGRIPKNDNPGYTYLSETRVVGTLIDAELDIADVEVLYATINGAPCQVYQTWNPGKIGEVLDYEEWDAATFGCREIHNIFLVESEEPIEIPDERTDYVIVEHHIMFRVYLTNGEYRDVLYGSDTYMLDIFGGGLMNPPQWYE